MKFEGYVPEDVLCTYNKNSSCSQVYCEPADTQLGTYGDMREKMDNTYAMNNISETKFTYSVILCFDCSAIVPIVFAWDEYAQKQCNLRRRTAGSVTLPPGAISGARS